MFTRKLGTTIGVGLLVVFGAIQAEAVIIDFDDQGVGSGANNTGGDFTSNGFFFDLAANHRHLQNDFFNTFGNGGTYLLVDGFVGPNLLSIMESGGATFDFLSADFGESGDADIATTVTVTGYYAAGGTVTQTVTLDHVFDGAGGVADFQSEFFNWTGLTKVTFEGGGSVGGDDYFSVDNLSVNTPVPEPATITLLGLGLAGMAVRRRRKQA